MTDYTKLLAALRNNDWSDACPCCDEAMCKDADCIILQAADAIEALQAEVKRLKECNDELREAQTYIDHYGDKWMTSAKDVPTSAYNHGYMDGKNEAEQALEPKRGEWLNVTDSYHWYGKCSVCGEEFVVDAYYAGGMNYCPNCGAKMEVIEQGDGDYNPPSYAWVDNTGEIVRCKECKHHEDEELGMVYCPKIVGSWVSENWYCADGEREVQE